MKNGKHPWGPGVWLDPAGPTKDVRICLTPTDELHIDDIRAGRVLTRSAAIREALASHARRIASARRGKKSRARA